MGLWVGWFVLESEIKAQCYSLVSFIKPESQWQTQGRTHETHINAN